MPLAVTLRLNDEAAVAVERLWCALAEQTGDDDALRLGYAPHVTLAVIADVDAVADITMRVFEMADSWDALPLTLAGLGVFPVSPPVIWVAPVATEPLLTRQKALHDALAPNLVDPHYHPGTWVPHITLSNSTRSVAHALEVALSVWSGPARGWMDRVDLVRFRPVEILFSKVLPRVAGSRVIGTAPTLQNSSFLRTVHARLCAATASRHGEP